MLYIKYILTTIGLCAGLVTAGGASSTTVTANMSNTHQTVMGIGGNAVYYEEWSTQNWNKEALYDTVFNGLGISALRMANWYNVNNDRMPDQAEIYKEALKHCGKNLPVVMSAWTCPADFKSNNDLNNGTLKRNTDGSYDYNSYAEWWKESLEAYRKLGVDPGYVSIQNEPDYGDNTYFTMKLDSTENNGNAAYGKALSATYEKINTLSNPPKFIGADNMGIGWRQAQGYINNLDKSKLAGYAYHYYHSGSNAHEGDKYRHPDDCIPAMQGLATDFADKPQWMTEYSPLRDLDNNDAVYTAWFMANAFNYNRVNYYIYWNLFWGDKENAVINIDTDTTKNKSAIGFKVNSVYHGLRHFSKFVRPGWQVTDCYSSSSDIIGTSFISADKDSATIVLINKSTSTTQKVIVSSSLSNCNKMRVIRTEAGNSVWSKDEGEQALTNSVSMPPMSIVTLIYHYTPKKCIYICDTTGSDWSTNTYWVNNDVPTSRDTAYIRKGEVKSANLTQEAPIYLEENGTFRVTNYSTIGDMHLQGGTIRIYTSSAQFTLAADTLYAEKPSTIKVVTTNGLSSNLRIEGAFKGSADITKIGNSPLQLTKNDSLYTGNWLVKEGDLQVWNKNALGNGSVIVDSGAVLSYGTECVAKNIIIKPNGNINMVYGSNMTVMSAVLGDSILPNGVYTSADFPDYLSGNGTLTVDFPYPVVVKHGAGPSNQAVTIGNDLIAYWFSFKNTNDFYIVWSNKQPDGVTVEIDMEKQTIKFGGTPTTCGIYNYTIYASNTLCDSVKQRKGSISVALKVDSVITVMADTTVARKVIHNENYKSLISIDVDSTLTLLSTANGICNYQLRVDTIKKFRIDTMRIFQTDSTIATWRDSVFTNIYDTIHSPSPKITVTTTTYDTLYTVGYDSAKSSRSKIISQPFRDTFLIAYNVDTTLLGNNTWSKSDTALISEESLDSTFIDKENYDVEVDTMKIVGITDYTVSENVYQYDITKTEGIVYKTDTTQTTTTSTEYVQTYDTTNVSQRTDTVYHVIKRAPHYETGISSTIASAEWSMWPNPTDGDLNVSINAEADCNKTVYLFSANGTMVKKVKVSLTAGNNHCSIDCTDLSKGIYTVSIDLDSSIAAKRLIVK